MSQMLYIVIYVCQLKKMLRAIDGSALSVDSAALSVDRALINRSLTYRFVHQLCASDLYGLDLISYISANHVRSKVQAVQWQLLRKNLNISVVVLVVVTV